MAKGSPTLSEVGLYEQSQIPGKAKIRIAVPSDYALDTQMQELLQLCAAHSIVSRPWR